MYKIELCHSNAVAALCTAGLPRLPTRSAQFFLRKWQIGAVQEDCAAAAVVATEVLYGASPACRDTSCLLTPERNDTTAAASGTSAAVPADGAHSSNQGRVNTADGGGGGGFGGGSACDGGGSDFAATAELSRCAGLLLEALADERLAGLPTHVDAAAAVRGFAAGSRSSGGGSELAAHRWTPQVNVLVNILMRCLDCTNIQPLMTSSASDDLMSLQVLGENAMLVRVVLESFGAVATALGPALAQRGTLVRLVLLPTLERIGAGSHDAG